MDDSALQHISPVWQRYTSIIAERAEGVHLYAQDGKRYLDFTCGIGVTNTGHCHPRVVAAAQEQIGKLIHGQANIVFHPPLLNLVEALQEVTPPGLDSFFFSNSGAEAVEAGIKLARQATRRPNIIVFQGSFHGRTIGAMSLTTSKTAYRAGYQPLMAGVHVAPFPYCHRCPIAKASHGKHSFENCCLQSLEDVRHLLHSQTAPEETAAVLVEPVLGEGGYIVPPNGFLQGLRQLCDEHGILLIFDEVQSGFGRTGKFFACEHWDVTPDIMVMAKGIASGFPLSGIVARRELMERWPPGAHGGTYGANAVSCAAAVATVRVLREEKLVENAARIGEALMGQLREVQAEFPIISDVRGLGLMVGAELSDLQTGRPQGDMAKQVVQYCLDDGLMLLTCGAEGNVIRWIPPLIVNEEQIQQAIRIFGNALAQATA